MTSTTPSTKKKKAARTVFGYDKASSQRRSKNESIASTANKTMPVGLSLDLRPDILGDLEIVPLVTGEIDQRRLSREPEIG